MMSLPYWLFKHAQCSAYNFIIMALDGRVNEECALKQ